MSVSSESSPEPSATISQDGSPEENPDESQLTIRIPNPKIYMARQSLWIGHRGKLRCDTCRAQNLKCDRVLPTCNHCAWTPDKECKYTPVPTPSHRGVPRCLSCQQNNLKCDRDLPICNQCKIRGNDPQCEYASKRRKGTILIDSSIRANPSGFNDEDSDEPTMSRMPVTPSAPSTIQLSLPPQPGPSASSQGRFASAGPSAPYRLIGGGPTSHDPSGTNWTPSTSMMPIMRTNPNPPNPNPPSPKIQPWFHLSFVTLPTAMRSIIATLEASEMPIRTSFENKLSEFLSTLVPQLAETACLPTSTYAAINRSLLSGEAHGLSPRMLIWVNCHRLLPGSTQKYLLLKPRDTDHPLNPAEEARLLQDYQSRVDQGNIELTPSDPRGHVFERLIVREQFYDVLAYAHRDHASSVAMTDEITGQLAIAGVSWPMADIFVELCPRCRSSRRRTRSNARNAASSNNTMTGILPA